MSRWLWALLVGVVLVAIAAFWVARNQPTVTVPVSRSGTPVAPATAPARIPQDAAPSPQPAPSPPAAQATAPPAPAPAATTPPSDGGQQAGSPAAPAAETPSAPPVVAQEPSAPPVVAQEPSPPPAPAPPSETPLPPPAPGREAPGEAQDAYAPKSLAQLVGAWAYSVGDCERLFQRRGGSWAYRQPVDKFAQAAIVESPKKILLPSAICRIESASEANGALKVSADCEDSISYTSRSVMITLRSPTELAYSASGDPVLATTLKKCTP